MLSLMIDEVCGVVCEVPLLTPCVLARGRMQDLNPAYHLLLRSELLGAPCPHISPDKAQQLEQLRSPCRWGMMAR